MKRYHSEPNIRVMEAIKSSPQLSRLANPVWVRNRTNEILADHDIDAALEEIDDQRPGVAVKEERNFKRKLENITPPFGDGPGSTGSSISKKSRVGGKRRTRRVGTRKTAKRRKGRTARRTSRQMKKRGGRSRSRRSRRRGSRERG